MITILYTITKEDELIFAEPVNYLTRKEVDTIINGIYEDVKHKANIKSIKHTKNILEFTDTAEGETDEVHKFEIIERKEVK